MATNAQLTVDERLERQESRTEIADLVSHYCRGCDTRDPELFMSIWHDDAAYNVGGPFGAYQDHAGILAGIQEIWEALPETHHWTTNLVLDFSDSDHATGKCDVVCECIDHDGKFLLISASYDDTFERRDGTWRIAYRDLTLHYRRSVPYEMYDAVEE